MWQTSSWFLIFTTTGFFSESAFRLKLLFQFLRSVFNRCVFSCSFFSNGPVFSFGFSFRKARIQILIIYSTCLNSASTFCSRQSCNHLLHFVCDRPVCSMYRLFETGFYSTATFCLRRLCIRLKHFVCDRPISSSSFSLWKVCLQLLYSVYYVTVFSISIPFSTGLCWAPHSDCKRPVLISYFLLATQLYPNSTGLCSSTKFLLWQAWTHLFTLRQACIHLLRSFWDKPMIRNCALMWETTFKTYTDH